MKARSFLGDVVRLSEELIDEFSPMVFQIAKEYARKYPMVDPFDIQQECWLWFVSHPNKLRDWKKLEDQKDATRLFARSLRNAAHDYCVKEKANVSGYETEDNFWYSKQLIKILLPAAISNDWKRVEKLSSEVRSAKSPSESGDWMAHAADVRKAFQKLNDKDQVLVFNFYVKDTEGEVLHEKFGEEKTSANATMMQANRALNKMVKHLGGFAPYKEKDYRDERSERSSED